MKRGYHGWTKTAVKWPNRIQSEIDAYPLVGLALTLLVIFMLLPTGTSHHHGWSVDLPQSRYASPMPRAVREDAQIVSVMRDGQIYYRNVRVMADDLPEKIRESVKGGADRKIYLRADARARYFTVKQVLAEIRQADIEKVCFFVEKVSS
ncbi:MAG TPA: biopolymer transporter ExbD [Candidatus Acidoferrum sp.]|nr:biopolymer transporter ExbD [Candidatus Acidoferrum sp.]